MNKKTKMWLGVGVVAVAAYYFWNKKKQSDAAAVAPKASMASMTGGVTGDRLIS
jgi:hypothetical protein